MKVVVEGGNQAVIDKLNELGHDDLEIVNEGGDLTLDEKAQELILSTDGVDKTNQLLMELIMSQHSDKFFKVDRVNNNPMKLNLKKLKKRRAKNKMARKSRQINYAKAKSKRKSHA
jgi:hypothetical protein